MHRFFLSVPSKWVGRALGAYADPNAEADVVRLADPNGQKTEKSPSVWVGPLELLLFHSFRMFHATYTLLKIMFLLAGFFICLAVLFHQSISEGGPVTSTESLGCEESRGNPDSLWLCLFGLQFQQFQLWTCFAGKNAVLRKQL